VIDDLNAVHFRAQPAAQGLVVVDRDDQLVWLWRLLPCGVDRFQQLLEALFGVARDHDAGGHPAHARSPSILQSCNGQG